MKQYHPSVINLPEGVNLLILAENHEAECPTCHQQTLLRPVTLAKALLRPLYLMSRQLGGVTPRQISETLGNVAYTKYTNLKYWHFIEPVDIPHANTTVKGWRMTDIGRMFLNGDLQVPETLWVYNDRARVVPDDMKGRMVTFEELTGYKEMSREIAASESMPLEASNTTPML